MPFQITNVRLFSWPDDKSIETALQRFELTVGYLQTALGRFADDTNPTIGRYTETLAKNLVRHLGQELRRPATHHDTKSRYTRYSQALDYNADLVISRDGQQPSLYFEIEFRPNFEKDLVKFMIGANAGRLALGILVVAVDRLAIRSTYTSMPQFDSVRAVVGEFRPSHPVLVLGIEGGHQ